MDFPHKQSLASRLETSLPKLLPDFLLGQRWFGGKARPIQSAEVLEAVPMADDRLTAFFILVRVRYNEGPDESYALPLMLASEGWSARLGKGERTAPIVRVRADGEELVFYDALWDEAFASFLLDAIDHDRRFKGTACEVAAFATKALRRIRDPARGPLAPSLMKAEQSNTSVIYGGRLVLKFFRRIEAGINPELEMGTFLTEKAAFAHIPPVAGAIEYRRPEAAPMTLAILQGYVPNQGDAWRFTLSSLASFFQRVATMPTEAAELHARCKSPLDLIGIGPSPQARELIGSYLDAAGLLGQRTAQLHLALASDSEDPDFAPEPFSVSYAESQYGSMRDLVGQVFPLLKRRLPDLPDDVRSNGQTVLELESYVLARFRMILGRAISAMRIRVHGDYHLGQVLYTGSDFVMIDFEGEPARPLSERRTKRSPLQDVAGMLRSFHYAAYTALYNQEPGQINGPRDVVLLEAWAKYWQLRVSAHLLNNYLEVAAKASFLPQKDEELSILMNTCLLEKAVYELGYELNNRPDWVRLPLQGILQLMGEGT